MNMKRKVTIAKKRERKYRLAADLGVEAHAVELLIVPVLFLERFSEAQLDQMLLRRHYDNHSGKIENIEEMLIKSHDRNREMLCSNFSSRLVSFSDVGSWRCERDQDAAVRVSRV